MASKHHSGLEWGAENSIVSGGTDKLVLSQ